MESDIRNAALRRNLLRTAFFCAGLREYWFCFRRSVTAVTLVIVRYGQVMTARMVFSRIVLRIAIKFYIEIKV